jgi:putative peptidoglycan lipid II flippase
MFPLLARGSAMGNLARYSEILKGAFRNVVFLTTPAALWLFFGSNLIVRLFFQHGEVTPADAQATAELVRLYSMAVVPTGLLLVVNRAFHASSMMYLPLIMGLGFAAFYVVIALILSHSLGIVGLPWAFTISQCVSLLVAFGFLVFRSGRNLRLRDLLDSKLALTVAVNTALAGGLAGWAILLEPALRGQNFLIQLVGLGLGVGLSGLFYLWLARRLAIPEAAAYLRMFQKKVSLKI